MRIACQEVLLPPGPPIAQWEQARRFGFDGVELIGDAGLVARRDELLAARRQGAVFASVCVAADRFIGDFDPERRAQARAHLRRLLDLAAELGAAGVVTPAAWGLWSNRLPRPGPAPRTPDGDREVLLEALDELGAHAAGAGVQLFFEPLNRYEDHMVNRLEQGVALVEACGQPAVRLTADLYHMNIEEADPLAALRAAGPWVGHVHGSDSNRLQPGAGHVDWAGVRAALDHIGYGGWVAIESRLSAPAEVALPAAARVLRG